MTDELKPVAWLYRDEKGDVGWTDVRQRILPDGWTETPLYTRPTDDRALLAKALLALKLIASCEKRADGDVVDIARTVHEYITANLEK